jgi:hypothetical protein
MKMPKDFLFAKVRMFLKKKSRANVGLFGRHIYQEATEPGHVVLATPLDHCKCCFINISKNAKTESRIHAFVISSAENILV